MTNDQQILVGDVCPEGTIVKVMSKKGRKFFVWIKLPNGDIRKGRLIDFGYVRNYMNA